MRRSLPSLHTLTLSLLIVFLAMLFFKNTEIAARGVSNGLTLCLDTLIPSLFPFLVLCELLTAQSANAPCFGLLTRPIGALLGVSARGAIALLLGLLCGLPVGAVAAMALVKKKEMTASESQRLMLFVNNPGAGFLIATVGEGMFGSRSVGLIVFAIVWISALLIAFFLRLVFKPVSDTAYPTIRTPQKPPSPADLTGCITRGGTTLLRVCAFVIFFSCISACLTAIPVIARLPAVIRVSVYGILEMTAGIQQAVSTLTPHTAFLFTLFFASFAGCSVFLQIFSIVVPGSANPLRYLFAKLLQAAMAVGLGALYLRLFRPCLQIADSVATLSPQTLRININAYILCTLAVALLINAACRCCRKKR